MSAPEDLEAPPEATDKAGAPPAAESPQPPADPAAAGEPGLTNRELTDYWLVRNHFLMGLCWLTFGMLMGQGYSLQLIGRYPWFLQDIEWFSPGRVRMLHTNMMAYGWLANAFLGGIHWAIPRITRQRTLSPKLGRFLFFAWQLVLVLTTYGMLTGQAQGIEWGETPTWLDPVIVVALVGVVLNFLTPIVRCKEPSLYVSAWYFTACFAWTGLTYIMGNFLPQYLVPGVAGAAIVGLWIHDFVGLFVTPLGWGLMYYFVPVILRKPIWSHSLSLIGFWGLAFFYPLSGVHHFLWSPIPMYAQYGAVVSTIAIEIVVATVIVNFFGTISGDWGRLKDNLPLRWFYTGMVFYFLTCFQCAVHVTLAVQEIIHFTDWVVGHAHLVMYGVFSFWLMGIMVYLWPAVTGREWYSQKLLSWHYWLTLIGLTFMFLDLTAAGLVQGFLWKALAPWQDSVVASVPFWWARTFSGWFVLAGVFCLLINSLLTRAAPGSFPEDEEATPDDA